MTLAENTLFPEMIEKLPDVDLALPGVKAKLFQGPGMQAVFFTMEGPADIPAHHHQAQWGVILEGEVEMTIDGQTTILRRGDSYTIPTGAVHSARVLSSMKALDFFNEAQRYKPKSN
ncbi:MAG: cupin domain-containing protein [Thermodesulfobacteriota bacterium]